MTKIVTLGAAEQVRYYKLDGRLYTYSGQELDPEELKQYISCSRSKYFLAPPDVAGFYLMPKDFSKAMEKAKVEVKHQGDTVQTIRLDGVYRAKHYACSLYLGDVCLVLTVIDQGQHHTVPMDLDVSSQELIAKIYNILKLTR